MPDTSRTSSFLEKHRVLVALVVLVVSGASALAVARTARAPAHAKNESAETAGGGEGAEHASPAANKGEARITSGALPANAGNAEASAPGGDHVAALRRGLASDDEATRIAAVEAAVSATAVETLGDLEKFDLAHDPETAPAVIHAVAMLGASADGAKRDEATGTLARWLRDEKRREGPDVPGNISNLVEAIGDTGGHDAAQALAEQLDRKDLPLHVETLAVQKLGELADPVARGAVERFATRVKALPKTEGLDEELRIEAIEAAQQTLSKL